jgi:thymidylate synthase (FAD)
MAGKVCYDSYGVDGRGVRQHVESLVDSGHHSVLEHVHVGVFIEGISRGCSHEIVRHRMFNYSQRSTRYTAEDDAAIVLDPYYADINRRLGDGTVTARELKLLDHFLSGCEDSFHRYSVTISLLSEMSEDDRIQQGIPTTTRDFRKWCRGKARQLLPHALETRMVMTGNLRAWRHFFLMRTSRHAEAEIRRLAQAIYALVEPIALSAFSDFRENEIDGYIELTEA